MKTTRQRFRQRLCGLIVLLASFVCGSSIAAERWNALYLPDFQTVKREGRPMDGPIRAFTQDSQGFIWITGDTTLWRWDGYELQKAFFAGIANDNPSLPDITVAKADPNGVVWVATSAGLFRLDSNTLSLHRVALGKLDSESLEHVVFDYSGQHKRLYLATNDALYEWSNGHAPIVVPGTVRNRIHTLLVDDRATLWVGTDKGLWSKSRGQAQFLQLPAMANTRISALYQAPDRKVWVGTAKDGVFQLENGQVTHRVSLPANGGIQPWVYDIHEQRTGELWFGTYGKGIIIYQSATKRMKMIRKERMVQNQLLDNDIWSLFRDRSGTLWIGSRTGANFLNANQDVFKHLPAGTPGTWLSDPVVYSMAVLPNGNVAVGNGNGGLDLLSPQLGILRHLPPGAKLGTMRIPEEAFESMFVLPDGNLMAGTNWYTLKLNFNAGEASNLRVHGRPADAYTSDATWFNGSLWVAGTDGLWQIKADKATNMMLNSPGEQRINSLLVDGDSLWIGTWKGLKRLRLTAEGAPKVSAISDPVLSQKYINTMHKDRNGRLWVGTYNGGLLYLDSNKDSTWRRISEREGLPSDKITGIVSDDSGDLWIGTDRGLAHIDAKTLAVDIIRPEAGAAAAPYENAVRTQDGDLLFGGNNGITVVTPSRWQRQHADAPLVFTAMHDGKGRLLSATPASKTRPSSLVVPADVDSVELKFAALDFINAPYLKYRYRLQGRDEVWRLVPTESRTVVLANLTPDDYQLQIGYSLDGTHWSQHALTLSVSILPEWHEQPLVRTLIVLLALGMLALLMRWRSLRSRRRQQSLEKKISDRTAELETVNQLLHKQAETIREASLTDPLTGLHNRRYFNQRIESEVQMAVRRYPFGSSVPIEKADLIFFLIDIDNFKGINDLLGHAAGDAVLMEMRLRLQSVFRASDFLIRWGGEEFLAVARGSSRANATELAERIRIAVNGAAIFCNKPEPVTVSCSIGFAPFPFLCGHPESVRWETSLALADSALYAAKNSGRNSWVGFQGTDQLELSSILALLHDAPETALHSGLLAVSRSS